MFPEELLGDQAMILIDTLAKICQVSKGAQVIRLLGNLSDNVNDVAFEEIHQFLEKNYTIHGKESIDGINSHQESSSFSNSDSKVVKDVMTSILNSVIEKEQKDLIDLQTAIDEDIKRSEYECKMKKRKLLLEREKIEKLIRANDKEEGIQPIFQKVNIAQNNNNLINIKQEIVFVSDHKTPDRKLKPRVRFASESDAFPNTSLPDNTYSDSSLLVSTTNSSLIGSDTSLISSNQNPMNEYGDGPSKNISVSTTTNHRRDLRKTGMRSQSVLNTLQNGPKEVEKRRLRKRTIPHPDAEVLKTEKDEIFGFRRGKLNFSCAKCEFITKSCALLRTHTTFSHGIGGAFKCEVCGKTYVRQWNFEEHRKHCSPEKGLQVSKRPRSTSCIQSSFLTCY